MKENGTPPLDPFPDGWYALEAADNLSAEQVIQKTWMGREIIIWRNRQGAVSVADAYCPHLGAHLGPESGGAVCEERLICPYHGFEFDITGQCVKIPQGPAPSPARLTTYVVQEINGFIFAYWDHQERSPSWRIPDFCPDGWRGRAVARMPLISHPQATTENSVDIRHLTHVHGYSDVKQLAPTVIEGPMLEARYSFRRKMLMPGLRHVGFPVNIKITVCGLGLSLVDIDSPATGLKVLQWTMATPVDGRTIDLWLAVDPRSPVRLPGLGWLSSWISYRLLPRVLLKELVLDVTKDAPIWKYMRYEPKPILAKGERDVARFRRYCLQFYPEPGLLASN